MEALKLGTMVKDKASGTSGMLTHLLISSDLSKEYVYQPKGLNPKNGQPVNKIFIKEERITGGEIVDYDLPLDILGSKGEDIATGFKGQITQLILHINGCLHVEVKPKGLTEDGSTIEPQEFDIRRMKGDKIKPLDEVALKKSIKKNPSPMTMIKKTP